MDRRRRVGNFTLTEKKVAKSLLSKYNSLLPERLGGLKMTPENNGDARISFNTTTGRQLDRTQWRKLCSQLRVAEAVNFHSSQNASKTGPAHEKVASDKLGDEMLNIDIDSKDTEYIGLKEEVDKCDDQEKDNTFKLQPQRDGNQRRATNFTTAEKEVAKSLLIKYNSLLPEKLGGFKLSPENNRDARTSFNTTTGRQLDKKSMEEAMQSSKSCRHCEFSFFTKCLRNWN